jgi:hypothetical protein
MAVELLGSKSKLIISVLLILYSVFWLDIAWRQVVDLRTAGQYVSPMRYARATAVWPVMLMYWIWNGWKSWQRYQADKG